MTTARAERIGILIEEGQISLSELQAVAANGNEFHCGLAERLGMSFEMWLRWSLIPNGSATAEAWAQAILQELQA